MVKKSVSVSPSLSADTLTSSAILERIQRDGVRKTAEAHDEANAIQHKHGSRKSGLPQTGSARRRSAAATAANAAPAAPTAPDDGQGQLF